MSKTKLLILILFLSTVLLGVGYAFWSENVIVSSTVSTGELRIELTPYDQMDDVSVPFIYYNGSIIDYDDSRIAPFVLSPDKHTLTACFKDVFPGMYYGVPFRMDNLGSIGAVLKKATIVSDIDDACLRGDDESLLLNELNSNLLISNLCLNVYNKDNRKIDSVSIVNGYPAVTLGNLQDKINSALATKKIRLEPGEYVQLTSTDGDIMGGNIRFQFGNAFGNNFENRGFSVKINLEWAQFNEFSE